MIGRLESSNEFFCDLNCRACQGFTDVGCLLGGVDGGKGQQDELCVSMISVMVKCFGLGVLLDEVYAPRGLWKEFRVLNPDTRPGLGFLIYKSEVEN